PRFIEAHRLCPYPGRNVEMGVVFDLMIHDLEIILHLVRSPVVSIDAVGVAVLSPTEDIANARIRFAGGAIANLTCSRISPEKMRKIRIFQDDAYLSLNYGDQCGEIYRKKNGRIEREPIPVERDEPLRLQIAAFVDCVRSHMVPVVDGGKGVAALDLAVQIADRMGEAVAAS
ncbi:MAG: gfo/Idh/MocA family oxidoreductase, partial [Methylacidiphilaceae bacterium]|nr:gfo/Idh/MocA family oxidoreductase [Candidatus Methylacidiphilaceae bacterium]